METDESAFELLLQEAGRISDEAPESWLLRLPIGSTLGGGRLRVQRYLGAGGMGVVLEAFDAQRGSNVALKVLSRIDPGNIYRIKNEFRALATVCHPNLVRLYELFAERDAWFFTMELVHGVSFDRWVRPRGQLDPARLRAAITQLIGALDAIHQAGKLHRDLKPSNVLVTPAQRLVVLDFGLAVAVDPGGVGQTVSDPRVMGTPAYMAPEQAAGKSATAASDWYALGVMLYEALTGRLPFAGPVWSLLAEKQSRAAARASEAAEVPGDLDDLCAALLARDPNARPTVATLAARYGVASASAPGERMPMLARGSPIYGRERELALLHGAFDATLSGKAVLVTVTGESGIGKSALCAAFLRQVSEARAGVVLAGRCFEQERVPFKAIDPVVDELSRHLRRLPPATAAALLPRDTFALARLFPILARVDAVAAAPARSLPDPPALRRHALAAFVELLARLRDRAPLVLHIDDLQWTDGDSAALLRQLLVLRAPEPILLLLSHRRPNDPQLSSVFETARENPQWQVRELALSSLEHAAIRQLVHDSLAAGGAAPAELSENIARESQGSPFWAHELCAALRSRTGDAAPPTLATLLDARRAALGARALDLLDLVAVAGRPLAVRVALAACAASQDDLDDALAVHLLRLTPGQSEAGPRNVECYHDRIREGLCSRIAPERKRALCRALAAGLAAGDEAEDDELLCFALEQAGELEAAGQHADRAAARAERALAFERAAELLRRALALRSCSQQDDGALYERLGVALAHSGRGADAARAYLTAASLAEGPHGHELRRRAAEELLGTGQVAEGIELLRAVCREVDFPLPASLAQALAALAWTTARLRLSGLDLPRVASASRREHARLEVAHTVVAGLLGYLPVHAGSAAAHYVRMALRAGDEPHLVYALGYNAAIYALFYRRHHGSRSWPRVLLARMDQLAEHQRAPTLSAFASMCRGIVYYHEGDFLRARALLTRAVAGFRDRGANRFQMDIANLYDAICASACGDYKYLSRVLPERIEEADRLNRSWVGTMMSGPLGAVGYLTSDQPAAFQRQLQATEAKLAKQAFASWPEYLLLLGKVSCLLYTGDPAAGWALVDARAHRYRRSLLTGKSGAAYNLMTAYRTACALGALEGDVAQAGDVKHSEWLPRARRGVAEALRIPHVNWPGLAIVLDARLALALGERRRGEARLREALRWFDEAGARMHAAGARRRLGLLLGGEQGRRMVADAERAMRAEGVVNVEAMSRLH